MASLTDDAIARIQQMIVSGELQPGQRLPPEKELSESLGLSRNSLREAVKALELIRVLDVRRGDGTYVTSLEPGVLLEVRRILEPASAVLATARASEQQIDDLATLMASVGEDTGVEDLVAHDLLFHSTIAGIGGNQYLSGLLDALSSKTVRVRVWRGLTQNGSVQRTLDEHAAIVDAIRRRDPQLVQSLVVSHVEGVERWLRRSLD